MRFRKWLLWGGIASLLLIVALWIATVTLAPSLLAQAEVQLSRTLQTRVRLGRVQVLLPWQVVVGPVSVASPQPPDLLQAPRANLGFNLLSYLFGQGLDARIEVQEPVISLRRDARGNFNLPRLEAGASQGGGAIDKLLSRVEIHRATFSYDDRILGGKTLTVRGIEAVADVGPAGASYRLNSPLGQGELAVEGTANLEQFATRLNARLRGVSAPALAVLLNLGELSVRRGTVEGALQLQYAGGQFSGTGPLRLVGGELALQPFKPALTNLDVTAALAWPRLALDRIEGQLAGSRITGRGGFVLPESLGLDVVVAGPLEQLLPAFTIPPVPVRGQASTAIQASIPFADPAALTANVRVLARTPVQVDRLVVNNLDATQRLANRRVSGPFRFDIGAGNVAGTTALQFVPGAEAQVAVAATGRAIRPEVLAERYGTRLPNGVVPGRLDFQARIAGPANQLVVTADFAQRGGSVQGRSLETTGRAVLAGTTLRLDSTRVRLGGGAEAVVAGQAGLVGNRSFSAKVDLRQLPLALASADLGGTAQGQIDLSGSLNSVASITGDGTVTVRRPVVNGRVLPPLETAFRLSGNTIDLDRLTLGGFRASGTLVTNLDGATPGPLLRQADLDLALDNFDLRQLPLPVRTAGLISGRGRFLGNLEDPDLRVDLDIRGARVDRYGAPTLTGPLTWRDDRVALRLTGPGQRWNLQARIENEGVRLAALDIASGETRVVAQRGYYDFRRGLTQLVARVDNLELGRLQLDPIGPLRTISGRTDARISLARTARGIEGRLEADIGRGRINDFALEPTRLRLQLVNNQVVFEPTVIEIEQSRYALSGRAGLGAADPISLDLSVENGRLEQLVRLAGVYSLSGLLASRGARGRAADLGVNGLGGEGLPLQQLLAVYDQASEVAFERMSEMTREFIPDDLRTLQGEFDLTARLRGSRRSPRADFDLAGSDFRWVQWRLDSIEARGTYRDGNLKLEEAGARYADRSGSLSGRLSLNGAQDARLVVDRFPLQLIEPLLPAGTQVVGNVSTEATIEGSLRSPVVDARVQASALEVNGRQVDPVSTELTLRSGRVALVATAIGVGKQGVEVVGSLPVPFLEPDDDALAVTVRFAGENLPLLNLISDQLVFQPAQGQAVISLRGTFDEPLIDGNIDLRTATVQIPRFRTALVLEQVLARFDLRSFTVERLAASLGGAQVTGAGTIPLRPGGAASTLAIDLGGNIDLPGLYRGGIAGQVTVGRALTEPRIGGVVTLNPGELLLTLQDYLALSGGPRLRNVSSSALPTALPIAFQDLRVRLGPNFRVNVSALNARLDGDIEIDGPLNRLALNGFINVPQANLTIGAARFRLDTSRRNALYFDGDLDPRLELRAEARVSEFRPTGVARLDSGELRNPLQPNDQTTLGRLDKIDIQATITGTASQPDIELTSSPIRDETEIIALIGGIGGGTGSLLTGLLPAVGSGLLRPVEQELASALGLDELRIDFASSVATATPQNIGIGVGIEALKDLSPAVSVSVFRNLSDNIQPTIFGVRYRISDQLVTRVSGNERLDNVSVSVQFEARF